MSNNSDILPIYLSETLRLNDYDDNQYVFERKTVVQTGVNAGNVVWSPTAYEGSVSKAKELYVAELTAKARAAAQRAFDASGLPAQILALPPKTGKKGKV